MIKKIEKMKKNKKNVNTKTELSVGFFIKTEIQHPEFFSRYLQGPGRLYYLENIDYLPWFLGRREISS